MMGGGPGSRMAPGEKPEKGSFMKNIIDLLKFMKPYAVPMIISILLSVGVVVLAIISPTYLGRLTDELANSVTESRLADISFIWNMATILIIFYVVEAAARYIASYLMVNVTQGTCKALRTELSNKINLVPLSYFDTHAFGDTLSRVTNDVDSIGQSVNQSFTMLVTSVLQIVGVIIAMFIVSWEMALAAICALPIMAIVLVIIMRFSQPQFRRQQKELGTLDGKVEESFSGHEVIKAFNAEDKTQADFTETNKKLRDSNFLAQGISGIMMPLMNVISYLAYAAVIITGGILIYRGNAHVTFGVLTEFIVYIRLFQSPMSQISQAVNMLQTASAASGRVFEFLAEPELTSEEGKEYKLSGHVTGNVEFRHVHFGYNPDRIIIPDFSATAKAGSKIAIVGPTGAGKTTMVNLLMRFYEFDGDILIDGVSTKDMPREEIHDLFGMVLQDTWTFEGTVRDNIKYSKDVTDEEIMTACDAANISHLISTLPGGLDYYLENEEELSGGQKQLLTIARAMVENAPMLILDEATSNVDTRTELIIQEAMDNLTRGRTSFVIAHRLSTIKNADLILVMRDGDIVEQGTHDELMAAGGFYSTLYNSQFVNGEEI